MTRKGPDLKKLVGLRRQRAEQALALLQGEIRADEQALKALETELGAIDGTGSDFDVLSLSHRHGRPGALIARIREVQAGLDARKARLPEVREALKNALHSEQRLSDLEAGR